MKLLQFINRQTGFRHWYQIKLGYKTDPLSGPVFEFTNQIGLVDKADILNTREVLSMFPAHKQGIPKHLLTNGTMYYEVMANLGWLKRK